MKKSIENKVRLNVVLIYIFVAVVCCGMIIYMYNLKRNVNQQKKNIQQYNQTLIITNDIILLERQAQSAKELYILSERTKYRNQYQTLSGHVEKLIDSLSSMNHIQQKKMLDSLRQLLNRNENIIAELNRQFNKRNPLDTINQKLKDYEIPPRKETVLVTTTQKDTVLQNTPHKGFWERIGAVFSPDKHVETTLSVTSVQADTLKISTPDSLNIMSDIQYFSELASHKYTRRIDKIRQNVGRIMISNQEVTVQIRTLLTRLHQDIFNTIILEIQKNEQLIQRNYVFLFISGSISLILILALVILIIKNVNKGYDARKVLEESNEFIRQLMEERHKLFLSISHDIKAPLGSIFGYFEVCKQTMPASSENVQNISSMQNSVKYISALLENLLDFSALEQGKLKLMPTDFNVGKLSSEVSNIFSPLAMQKGLSFHCQNSIEKDLWVCSDSLKIERILGNILSNAIKYTHSGSIKLITAYENGLLSFSVTDTGVGIPSDKINEVCKPFSRINSQGSASKGSGFGMYVVKGLLELLKGKMTILSKEGEGTQVEILIPVQKVDVPVSRIPKEDASLSKKEYKLLVIDDDKDQLYVLGRMLSHLGHKVDVCSTIFEFENYASVNAFSYYDIILTDMEMGKFSGVDILAKTRSINKSIPVLLVTAHSNYDNEIAIKLGFNGYLRKPFDAILLSKLFRNNNMQDEKIYAQNTKHSFAMLRAMFDDDVEEVKNILSIFIDAAAENLKNLHQAVVHDDFAEAQLLCHKMQPSFTQLEAGELLIFLQKMDVLRGKTSDLYPKWKEDAALFIINSEAFIEKVKQYIAQKED